MRLARSFPAFLRRMTRRVLVRRVVEIDLVRGRVRIPRAHTVIKIVNS